MKDQRVWICLEYARVNNAREVISVISATLGRSLKRNVYFLPFLANSRHFQNVYSSFLRHPVYKPYIAQPHERYCIHYTVTILNTVLKLILNLPKSLLSTRSLSSIAVLLVSMLFSTPRASGLSPRK